jgi:tRNA threonylcarbamoyladenosine biosynthesis protein TsaE
MNTLIIPSASEQETRATAARLAAFLKGGDILFFRGPIGAGKTVMVSAIAAAFGFKKAPVSASFSLMKKYKNKKAVIYHIDLFRVRGGEMFNLGFEEMLEDENSIILAEWPDAAEDFFPQNRLETEVKLKEGNSRDIIFSARGKRYADILDNLCKRTKA